MFQTIFARVQHIKLKALLVGLVGLIMLSANTTQAQSRALSSEEAAQVVSQIERVMNQHKSYWGSFTQTSSATRSTEQGVYYIERPGKMNFDYKIPSTFLFIADGRTFTRVNKRLKTLYQEQLSRTPLNILLGKRFSLRSQQGMKLKSLFQTKTHYVLVYDFSFSGVWGSGRFELLFSRSNLHLASWRVRDSQGVTLTVALQEQGRSNRSLQASLFQVPEMYQQTLRRDPR